MIEKITDMIYVERDVLSQEQCDELIKYFWDSEDKHDDGKVEHFKDGEYKGKLVNKDHKNCTQFMFEPGHKYANLMTEIIQNAYLNYRYQLPVLPARRRLTDRPVLPRYFPLLSWICGHRSGTLALGVLDKLQAHRRCPITNSRPSDIAYDRLWAHAH